MTGLVPRDTREWMRTIERGLLQNRSAAASLAASVVIDKIADYADVVNTDRNRVPAAPIELTSQTYIALDPATKRFGAGVIVDFPDVTIGNDAQPMSIEQYELWGRTGTNNFGLLTTATVSSLQWFGAVPGAVWDFKARAIGSLSVKPGVFSTTITVTMTADTVAPGIPSTPGITAAGKTALLKWDGKIAGGATMPLDLDYVIIAGGAASSPTTEIGRFAPGPGVFADPNVPYGSTRYYRLRAVDTAGNLSGWSAQVTAVGTRLVDDDLILSLIDGAVTQITNVGSASIINGAITATKLADNSISQAKLQDQIISLAKLDLAANTKIQKGVDDAFAAQSAANAADGKAVTALTNAATADGKAGTAQTAADKAQAVVDAAVAAGANLNINGNFDAMPISNPPLGWPSGALAVVQASTTTAHSGTNVLKCSPSTGSSAYRYTDFVASATGRVFYVEYWVRADQAIIAANAALKLGVFFDGRDVAGNASNSPQYGSAAVGAQYPEVPLSALSTTGWTKFSVVYKVTQANNAQMRFGPRIPNLTTAGNTFEVDGFRVVDMTEAQSALDAAATAQAKADQAFSDAQTALTNAGLAQTSASGKNANYYTTTAPSGTGFTAGDNWFRGSDNRLHKWVGAPTNAWVSIQDSDIGVAKQSAIDANAAAATADGKAVAAQTKANKAESDAAAAKTAGDNAAAAAATADGKAVAAQTKANTAFADAAIAKTAGDNAAVLANAIVKTSTSDATGTPPSAGALWNKTNGAGDLIIKTWTANTAGTAWVVRQLDDAVIGNLNAATINAGIINAARFNAADIRAKFIEAGKITAGDIVTGALTSASGVFGTVDASILNAGTLNAARLNAGDIRAKFLTAGLITAGDIVTGTLTSASGVFGTMDASVITAGTINAARLLAGDIRAKFLAAGKITADDMVANTITAESGVIASLDLGKATVGELNGIYVKAFSLAADTLKVGSGTNLFPDPKMIDVAGWGAGAGVTFEAVGTGKNGQGSILIAASGTQVGSYYSNGDVNRRIAVSPNSSYRLSIWVRSDQSIPVGGVAFYARQYPLDGSAFSFTTPGNISNDTVIAANTWAEITGVVATGAVPCTLVVGPHKQSSAPGNTRFSDPRMEVMGVGRLIVDGTIQGNHIMTNSISAKHMTITDLTNFAPSLAESPTDYTLTNQMSIVSTGLDVSGWRFQVTDGASESRGYGPYMAVAPGESLWMGATVYRGSATVSAWLRYYFYDATKTLLAGGSGTQYIGVPQSSTSGNGTRLEGAAIVPAGAAYARWTVVVAAGTGSTGLYNIQGRRRLAGELIIDGTITSDKVATNAITAQNLLIGDFANLALGSDFEDPKQVPWALSPMHTISTTQKKSGTSSLKLVGDPGTDTSTFTGDLRVKEGEQWYFKFHAYIDTAFNGASNSKLRISDQTGTPVLGFLSFAGITRNVWTTVPLETVVTVPAGVTSLQVTLNSDHTAGLAYVDDIQIRRMSEASLIQNLGVEKLTASAANINIGVIDKLYTDVVRSRKITTDMLVVAGENLIPDPYFLDAVQNAYRTTTGGTYTLATDDLSTAGTLKSTLHSATPATMHMHDTASMVPVFPNEDYNFVLNYRLRGSTVAAKTSTLKFALFQHGPDGAYLRTVFLATTTRTGANGSTWLVMDEAYTIPADCGFLRVALQFTNEAATAELEVKVPRMKRKLSAALIVDGAILTKHLTVTDDMVVKFLQVHKIKATEVDITDLTADTGFIVNAKATLLTADVIKAQQIDAVLGITSKHTITGATIQTLTTANRGIKMAGGNFTVYDATGLGGTANKTFEIIGSTGAVSGTGVWKTGSSGNYIEMNADVNGAFQKFWTGTGTGRGNIYARDDAGGKRMTITYSDLDAPGYTVPLLALWDDKVNLSYGSKRVQVGKNAGGGEELLLDATGADVMVRGGLELADSSARVRWRYSASNFALGYIGQRPETNSGIADFEVRAAANGVRLSGTELIANPIYTNTSSSAANVVVDVNGKVWRSTSASRYKADQRILRVPDSILDIEMKDWVDKNQMALHEEMDAMPRPFMENDQARFDAINLTREPGVIAEDVAAHGGEQFTIYGPDGQTEGVKYPALALAQIQVLLRRLEEAEQRIAELQGA